MLFKEYMNLVKETDQYPDSLDIVLFGLFGEIGSVMEVVKKRKREKNAFADYKSATIEEFGDSIWYFAAICMRFGFSLDEIFDEVPATSHGNSSWISSNLSKYPIARAYQPQEVELYPVLFQLGKATADLLLLKEDSIGTKDAKDALVLFAGNYISSIRSLGLRFSDILDENIKKTWGRFIKTPIRNLPVFDSGFCKYECLPEHFEIDIVQLKDGKSRMKWNDVFIGAPLADNSHDEDGYRFHDVFHMAHAAVLNWSPTFRGLIRRKRKSNPRIDAIEDGGRAIVIEEGLTAWIFSRAKDLDFFENEESLSFDMLKTIQQFVKGYEVCVCTLNLWEKAILDGYKVFREVKKHNGGVVLGDLKQRTIRFKPPQD